MIDDINDYALRVQKMMSYFDPEKAASMTFDTAQAQAFKKFLSVLAVDGKDGSGKPILVFNIVSNGANSTINGKDMNQVAVLYNEYVGSSYGEPNSLTRPKKPRN